MRGLPEFKHPDLIIGAEDFSDAGVFRVRDDLLMVQSLDFFPPLVDDPFLFGQIAAANSMSDIFAMGAEVATALNIVGFPDDQLELSVLNEILRGGAERVLEAQGVIVGGHTVRDVEIKYGLSVTGLVAEQNLLSNQGAKPGEVLVLSKALGTGFVTTAFKMNRCPEGVLKTATDSMSRLNRGASLAACAVKASGSTDITGFGLAGHAGEMAQASEVTIVLELDKLPLLPGAAELVRSNKTRASATNRSFAEPMLRIEADLTHPSLEFLFDAQTSGGLLLSVAAERANELVERARESGADAACIVGYVEPRQDVALIVR